MKRVLITGANSYVGESVKKYLVIQNNDYIVDVADMLSSGWRETSFSKYDVVFNVCAIVHRPDIKNKTIYYTVNRDLAIELAKKSKNDGVKQFIQMSTDGVFGKDAGIMDVGQGFCPKSYYEKSKYEADCFLEKMRDSDFKVCIVRPPLIFGIGCKGNFPKLERFSKKAFIFPSLNNRRDFIFIENLCSFIEFAIANELDEICYPRDKGPTMVKDIVLAISKTSNHKIVFCSLLNPFVKLFIKTSHKLRLVFGDNYYIGNCCSKGWDPEISTLDALKQMYGKI